MWRYIRLYACFVRFSLSRIFEFRIDFWLNFVMAFLYAAQVVCFYEVIFLHMPSIGGWGIEKVRFLVAAWLIVDALQTMLIGDNMADLPVLVNKGQLDYYLLRPVSSLFFVSLRQISAVSWLDLVIGSGALWWAWVSYPEHIALWKLFLYLGFVLNGVCLFYLIRIIFLLPVFWIQGAEGLQVLFWSFHRFAERPDRLYKGTLRAVLTTVVPFCLIVSFPTRILVDTFDWKILLQLILVTAALWSILLFGWNRALRAYSSASS